MNMTYHIPEVVVPGWRLGRNVNHDPRSFGFPFHTEPKKLTNVYWPRATGILDQDGYGACTGFAMCGCAACGPVYSVLPVGHPALDYDMGMKLYSDATHIDPYAGSFPPDDTGSDGVSVMKAAVNNNLISGYTHTFDFDTALQAIMTSPVIIGLTWWSNFDYPDPDGYVEIGGSVRGGHEVLVRGLDVTNSRVLLDNSWGPGWGKNGTFNFSFDTFGALLDDQGDCTVPVPLTAPKPAPVPVIYTANGAVSLKDVSNTKGTPVSTILKNTVKQYKAFSGPMSGYLQQGDMRLPIPSGEKLCLAWPQYTIS